MLKSIYNQKVTILNKLKRQDTNDKTVDLWYKTVIEDAAWYTDSARNSGGNGVYIGTYIKVLIPFHEEYVPYIKWKTLDDKGSHFTVASGDYIILGEVPETITAQNVITVLESYGEDVCQVKHHKALYNRFGARVQLEVEGV